MDRGQWPGCGDAQLGLERISDLGGEAQLWLASSFVKETCEDTQPSLPHKGLFLSDRNDSSYCNGRRTEQTTLWCWQMAQGISVGPLVGSTPLAAH